MKNIFHARWLTVAAGLCLAANIVNAADQLTFTDSWHDTLAGNANDGYFVNTTGSASIAITLPLNGVDLSAADAGTMFTITINDPDGNSTQIISDTLGDSSWTPGKMSAKFGSLTVSWTATTLSVTGTATNDVLGEEGVFSAESPGTATNYDLASSITGDYFEVIVTLDASDNGGGTFNYDNANVPVTGSDKETDPNPDGNGPYPLEVGSITGTGDFTPPAVTITSPPAGFKVYDASPTINLAGQASDNIDLSNVQYYVNGDTNNLIDTSYFPPGAPMKSISWTTSVNLNTVPGGAVGNNVITVVATDTSGNTTSVSRTFVWVETNFVFLATNPPDAGKITGIKNGQVLQVGSSYAVTATATNKDWIFFDWTESPADLAKFSSDIKDSPDETILSSNATFEFFDSNDTNVTLTASFVPNPFNGTDLAGTYTGLFYDTNNGIELDDAGYISLAVTGAAGYSGKLYLASSDSFYTLSGQLAESPDGSNATAELTIPVGTVSKPEYLAVNLLVATDTNLSDPGAGTLGGFVNAFSDKTETNELDSAEIQGALALYNTNIPVGLYNIVIPSTYMDPSQGPGGYSYGSATVSDKTGAAGAVALVLHLADGTTPALSFSTFLASNGICPLYASLYSGKGVIMGWMQFATDGSGVISNNAITWGKMPVADKCYTNGFTSMPALFGHLYVPPRDGTNILGWENGEFIFDLTYKHLSLPDATYVPASFDPNNNTFTASDRVTITLTATTGALSGSFYPAVSRATFSGVVISDGDAGTGYGFYADTNKETGPILITSP